MLILNAHAGHILAFARVQLVVVPHFLNFSLTVNRLAARHWGGRCRRGGRGRGGSLPLVHARRSLGRASFDGHRASLILLDIHLFSNSYPRFGRRLVGPTALRSWQLRFRQRIRSDWLLVVLTFVNLLRGQTRWLIVGPKTCATASDGWWLGGRRRRISISEFENVQLSFLSIHNDSHNELLFITVCILKVVLTCNLALRLCCYDSCSALIFALPHCFHNHR